jgi:Mor family transcriptional regulator
MPFATQAARQLRNARIVRAKSRLSVRELALKHELTERQVYNILAAAKRAAQARP